ncbi:MAG: DegT/DnrJ/EryC1/StrS aminotransferase family protein [Steroidobacteraceae bacterium]|nr:DegT/DnrJ/EryC1/StrS aminotransferase family protein [Steroidobacteraceae bacterium]
MSGLFPVRALPPVGDPVRLRPRSGPATEVAPLQGASFLDSGTAALAFILKAIVTYARKQGFAGSEVLIPAYGCPDIVSAIEFAGCRARLVDVDGDSPFPSQQAWVAGIDERTLAVVSVGFLGLRDPLPPVALQAGGLAAHAFVEDCCQVHPMAVCHGSQWRDGPTDRNLAFSFGRGKPVSMLHGGAARLVPDLVPYQPVLPPDDGRTVGFARLSATAGLYNLLRSPWLYGWVERLPCLGVGHTEYTPLRSLQAMNPRVRDCVNPQQDWPDQRRLTLQKRIRECLLESRPKALAADLWRTAGREDDWLLRYPLLMQTREARDEALTRLREAGLGVSAMYRQALPDIAGVRQHLAEPVRCDGARRFADRLLTLPLHRDVRERDVLSMCDLLTQVGRS